MPIHLSPCRWVNRQRAFSQVLTKQGKIVVEGVNAKVRSNRVLLYLSLRGTLLHSQTLASPVGCFLRFEIWQSLMMCPCAAVKDGAAQTRD